MHGDNHFGNRIIGKTRGCGAKLFDVEAKPGDHLRKLKPREKRLKILKIVLIIIFLPLVLLLYIPVKSVKADWRRTQGRNIFIRCIRCILIFLFNLTLGNYLFLCQMMFMLIFWIIYGLIWLLTCGCCCCKKRDPYLLNARKANE